MSIKNNRLTKAEYEKNFTDIHPPFENKEAALVEANRCLFCYDAPCIKGCPTKIDIPKFIKQITTDNLKGSAHTIFISNIFGGGCSRVCPVEKLCEGNCVYNLLDEKPIEIAKLQRWSTDKPLKEKWKLFDRNPIVIGVEAKKVAIVGAGPAGLSCAHVLSREGIDVTIFEKESKGGGLMTYGIAAYKVTPAFCEEEVDFITSLGGIDINYDQAFGKDITLEELKQNYDAVYLGIGVGLANKLGIPGEELEGVEDAIKFIYDVRTQGFPNVPVGDKVAVIGMGMTAIDAATQAKRLGAKEVTMVYRRSEAEKNCTQVELDIALLDGCKMQWLSAPKEIIGENGKAKALICDVMKLGAPDYSGKPAPISTGETFILDVDMVIKATGQSPFIGLVNENGIENNRGKILLRENYSTNIKGVFAGGDAVNGGKEVVDAVQAGKEGAASILKFLNLK
ncbi:MAG TPA: NAD(P)-dependent oxidoreductase [Chitinophagaceae bacterium]|nr:NAD(P)-dependent oxidoreductase [Chitinophagaceae bacterium]